MFSDILMTALAEKHKLPEDVVISCNECLLQRVRPVSDISQALGILMRLHSSKIQFLEYFRRSVLKFGDDVILLILRFDQFWTKSSSF